MRAAAVDRVGDQVLNHQLISTALFDHLLQNGTYLLRSTSDKSGPPTAHNRCGLLLLVLRQFPRPVVG